MNLMKKSALNSSFKLAIAGGIGPVKLQLDRINMDNILRLQMESGNEPDKLV